jgi:hypothetical protein
VKIAFNFFIIARVCTYIQKDILRHSSTRRTITRFIAVIIITVSIEALLMIFKFSLKGVSSSTVETKMTSRQVIILIGVNIRDS